MRADWGELFLFAGQMQGRSSKKLSEMFFSEKGKAEAT
jgi:hypothetical protein